MTQITIAYVQLTGLYFLINNLLCSIFIDEKLNHPALSITIFNLCVVVTSCSLFFVVPYSIAAYNQLTRLQFLIIGMLAVIAAQTLAWRVVPHLRAARLMKGLIIINLVTAASTFAIYCLLKNYACTISHTC